MATYYAAYPVGSKTAAEMILKEQAKLGSNFSGLVLKLVEEDDENVVLIKRVESD